MSWSDDTRCLYCEGRLPLYRKITHGQFCSSAHRKSYWQEHERLAVERLHQTHSSLRSYRSVPQEAQQESNPYPEQEPATLVGLAIPEEPDFEVSPASFMGSVPLLAEDPLPASDLLRFLSLDSGAIEGSSPAMIAADPFEYETACHPLPPSHRVEVPATNAFPEGPPAAAWSYLGPRASDNESVAPTAGVEQEYELALCQPQSRTAAASMGTAGRVGLPLAVALQAASAAVMESQLQVLEMEPSPVTSVALGAPLQSDIILELLDQQVPRPDRLCALNQFGAYAPSALALVCHPPQGFDSPTERILPFAAGSIVAADYRLAAPSTLMQLPLDLLPTQGNAVRREEISEIPTVLSTDLLAGISQNAQVSTFQVGIAGLQSLGSNLSRPVQKAFALQMTGVPALDLSTGVSSDVTFPTFAAGASVAIAPRLTDLLPLTFVNKRRSAAETPRVEPIARLLPQAVETHPMFPQSGLEPLDRKPPQDALRTPETLLGSWMRGDGLKKLEPAWAHATGFWHHAPRDLKLLLFAIPALLALVFHPGLPRIAFAAPRSAGGFSGGFTRALGNEWVNVRQTLENRAAIALDEDFRSGLDNWASPGGSTAEWSFDSTGFVRPGPLALYRPTVNLADYQLQFMGTIDKKALSWVVRAADFENFYVVKLTVVKAGPIPAIGLTRYAVIHGKARDRHDVSIPLSARPDTLYSVRMDVQGSNFTVEVQDQIADSWTETRLPRGGIGFFTASGEASRLRWVQITHQYDMLGRLCAFLAPYDTTNGSWQP